MAEQERPGRPIGMAIRYLCHDRPDLRTFDTEVVDTRPGAVVLAQSAFYPGGGGQLPDRGLIRWAGGKVRVERLEGQADKLWHLFAEPVEVRGQVQGVVDGAFRQLMCQLHTDLHILNALVYQEFEGALVTGVQMAADGTARIDFDLPMRDNNKLRALEPTINDAIRQDLAVRQVYVAAAEAAREPGLIRSQAVAPPPQPDGSIRVVEIIGLDRQACGGTHLGSTGQSAPVRVLKVDNKGRHNRRIRIGLIGV
jgi:misacylated tRNA(Ala) deacylase